MATALHILTMSDDTLAEDVIARQRTQSGQKVEVVDLTVASPDYMNLLDRIFTADSVAVW